MAVIPDVDGLKVEVVTNGEPLEEYVDNEEERVPETVTKYIEAKSGEEFGVRWTIAHPYPEYGVLFDVYLDGKFIRGAFARQHIFVGPSISHVISGRCCIVKDEWYMQKFCFTELTVDDSDGGNVGEALTKALKEIGEITIRVFHVQNFREVLQPCLTPTAPSQIGTVPEKALKGRAISHQTSVGEPQPAKKGSVLDYDYVHPAKKPFATFHFRYRSRNALRALCLIPRTPSPVQLEDRNPEDLTREEAIELLRRQTERNEAAQRVKQEHVKRERSRELTVGAVDDDDEISIVSVKRRRLPPTLNEDGVEMVDLT